MDISINYDQFKNRCNSSFEDFMHLGNTVYNGPKKDERYIFIDNGADILAIGHLDSVQKAGHFYVLEIGGEEWVMSPVLDDRQGVYAILDLLPSLGLKYDILLTENEECGKSTGQYFQTEKKYKWMFEFDRGGGKKTGGHVVTYMYDTKFLHKRLKRAGFNDIQKGMGSDISRMTHLGCCGFNVATGYEDYHDLWAKASMDVFKQQISTFVNFYNMFKELDFRYELPKKPEGWIPNYKAGYKYDHASDGYIPYTPPPGVVTHYGGMCVICNTYVFKYEQSPLYEQIKVHMHLDCEAMAFQCLGCGKVKKVDSMTQLDLCDDCNKARLQDGNDQLILVQECLNRGCETPLTWQDWMDGGLCKKCQEVDRGADYHPLFL